MHAQRSTHSRAFYTVGLGCDKMSRTFRGTLFWYHALVCTSGRTTGACDRGRAPRIGPRAVHHHAPTAGCSSCGTVCCIRGMTRWGRLAPRLPNTQDSTHLHGGQHLDVTNEINEVQDERMNASCILLDRTREREGGREILCVYACSWPAVNGGDTHHSLVNTR